MRSFSAPQLKRELHRTGVCVRFQSGRTLPVSRFWNDYFPLSSLCAIFVFIILPVSSIVNAKIVTFLFHLFLAGIKTGGVRRGKQQSYPTRPNHRVGQVMQYGSQTGQSLAAGDRLPAAPAGGTDGVA